MREILTELDRWQQQNEEIALATLVCVRGSSPRLPGARLCVTRSAKMVGSVSGGCVESDVFERALQVLDQQRPALATYGISDETGFRVGLTCGGSIDVLIEPFATDEVWQAVRAAVEAREPAAWGIALEPENLLGHKLALLADDRTVGSIGSGIDDRVIVEARRLLLEGGARTIEIPHGAAQATIFVEAFPPPLQLYIVGATHTAIPLCRMASDLGFRVTVIDPRGLYATRERFAEADEIIRAWPHEVLDRVTLDAYSYIVTLTHDPKFDIPTLTRALRSGVRYIGAIGSRVTHERRKARLREEGFSDAEFERIHSPVGLDIGARTPEEVALAIVAEMVAVRNGRRGGPLRERQAAIHARG